LELYVKNHQSPLTNFAKDETPSKTQWLKAFEQSGAVMEN
jgi:hypothetical protein